LVNTYKGLKPAKADGIENAILRLVNTYKGLKLYRVINTHYVT
jgi:hypothetical protein